MKKLSKKVIIALILAATLILSSCSIMDVGSMMNNGTSGTDGDEYMTREEVEALLQGVEENVTVNAGDNYNIEINSAYDGNLLAASRALLSSVSVSCTFNVTKVVSGGLAPMMMSALPRVRMMMAAPVVEEVPEEPEVLPEVTPNPGGTGNDPDLDVEGEIPDYIPGADDSSDSAFESFIDMIKSFIDRVIGFFKNFINLMGGK
jgi:hypothetical protein